LGKTFLTVGRLLRDPLLTLVRRDSRPSSPHILGQGDASRGLLDKCDNASLPSVFPRADFFLFPSHLEHTLIEPISLPRVRKVEDVSSPSPCRHVRSFPLSCAFCPVKRPAHARENGRWPSRPGKDGYEHEKRFSSVEHARPLWKPALPPRKKKRLSVLTLDFTVSYLGLRWIFPSPHRLFGRNCATSRIFLNNDRCGGVLASIDPGCFAHFFFSTPIPPLRHRKSSNGCRPPASSPNAFSRPTASFSRSAFSLLLQT